MRYNFRTDGLNHVEMCLLDAIVMSETMGDRGLHFRIALAWLRLEPGQLSSAEELMDQPFDVVINACNEAVITSYALAGAYTAKMQEAVKNRQQPGSLTPEEIEKLERIKW